MTTGLTSHASRLHVESLERRETPATLFALTQANLTVGDGGQIARFDSSTPGTIDATVPIQNLLANEQVVGIDYRPRTGGMYALGVNGGSLGTTGRLLLVNPLTGAAGQVGAPFLISASGSAATASYGFDFNPTVDRIRVVNSEGLNLRLNPNDGSVTTDTPLSPVGQSIGSAAYDRNFDGQLGANGTTLYTINSVLGQLQTQGGVNQIPSPNGGAQIAVGTLGVSIDPTGGVGFDIAPNGAAAAGPAFAMFDSDLTTAVSTRLYTIDLTTGAATSIGEIGNGIGNYVGLTIAPESRVAVGNGRGTDSRVEVYDPFSGRLLRTLNPFPGFLGGVTVAMADVNRDSVPDVIVGASAGAAPHVKVFDGASGAEVYSFFAFDPGFPGGVTVAGGDVNGDGFADLIVGAGPGGGPHVRVFSGQTGVELASYFPYDVAFTGGVRVSAGDFNTDGVDEIVTAAGPGGGPHVRVFARDAAGSVAPYAGGGIPNSFFAYDAGFAGGVWVATGDVNGDGFVDVMTGADTGGGPHVKAFSGQDGGEIASFFAYDDDFTGGVRVGVGDTDRDGRAEVLVAPASNRSPEVRAFDANIGVQRAEWDVLDGASGVFLGGVVV